MAGPKAKTDLGDIVAGATGEMKKRGTFIDKSESSINILTRAKGVSNAKSKMISHLRESFKKSRGSGSKLHSDSLLTELWSKTEDNPLHEINVLPDLFSQPGFRFGIIHFEELKRKDKKEMEEKSASPVWAMTKAMKAKKKFMAKVGDMQRRVSKKGKPDMNKGTKKALQKKVLRRGTTEGFLQGMDSFEAFSSHISEQALTVEETDYSNLKVSREKRYLRVPNVASMENESDKLKIASGLYYSFLTVWKERPPGLLISVTGTTSHKMDLVSRFYEAFSRDLMQLVDKTQAWIIDHGTDMGISNVLGDIRYSCGMKCPLIGIVSSGEIKGNLALNGGDCRYPDVTRPAEDFMRYMLDENHSHFILVDEVEPSVKASGEWDPVNSKQNSLDSNGNLVEPPPGAEMETRRVFERAIRTFGEHQVVYVPSITLVCGGGKGSIRHMHASLFDHKPVVVLKESGRVVNALVAYMSRGGHVSASADLNKNGIEDEIEELFCEAFYNRGTQELSAEDLVEFSDLLKMVQEISQMAVKEHMLTVYDVESDVNLLDVCMVAINGTDVDEHLRILTISKWAHSKLAHEILQSRPLDARTAGVHSARARLKWVQEMCTKYGDFGGSGMMASFQCLVSYILSHNKLNDDRDKPDNLSDLARSVQPGKSEGTSWPDGKGKQYVEYWMRVYSHTEDEVLAYAAFRNHDQMVRVLKDYGFGNILLDALIRVEMEALFERAADIVSKEGLRAYGIAEEDGVALLNYLKREVKSLQNLRQDAIDDMMMEAFMSTSSEKNKENEQVKRDASLITWDRIFFSIFNSIKEELIILDDISEEEADQRLEDAKYLFMSKVLIFTKLLPIHSRNRLDVDQIPNSLVVKTAISFISQYKANQVERLNWDSKKNTLSEDLELPHLFKLHPIQRIWWSLLSVRAELTQCLMGSYSNLAANIMLLSRSGFADMCVPNRRQTSTSSRIYRKMFLQLTDDLAKRLFGRLGDVNEVASTFKADILPKFKPSAMGPQGLLCGTPVSANEALLECLLFVGLPRGKEGEILVDTFHQLSVVGGHDSQIGSLDFLEAMVGAPKATQQSEILDNIIDYIWFERYERVWKFEFLLFFVFFLLNMVMLTGGFGGIRAEEDKMEAKDVSAIEVTLVLIFNSIFLLKEVIQMRLRDDEEIAEAQLILKPLVRFKEYFFEGTNSMDILAIISGFVFPFRWWNGSSSTKEDEFDFAVNQIVSSVVIALNLCRLLMTYSKGSENMSWLVKVIIVSVYDMRFFLAIMFLVIIAFSFIFRLILQDTAADCGLVPTRDDDNPLTGFEDIAPDCDPGPFGGPFRSLVSTFQMVFTGAYDEEVFIKQLEKYDDYTTGELYFYFAWLWFSVLIIVIVVVSLNAMIALLGNSFQNIKDDELAQKRMDRLELIVEYFQLDMFVRSKEMRDHCEEKIFEHLHEEAHLVGFITDVLLQRSDLDTKYGDFDIKKEIRSIKDMVLHVIDEFNDADFKSASAGALNKAGEDAKARIELQRMAGTPHRGHTNHDSLTNSLTRKSTRRFSVARDNDN